MIKNVNKDAGWLRITISRVSAAEHGMSRDAFSNVIIALERGAFLERYIGYPGALKLEIPAARMGRPVVIRAARRLIDVCERQGINATNLFTHFPSIG